MVMAALRLGAIVAIFKVSAWTDPAAMASAADAARVSLRISSSLVFRAWFLVWALVY